MTFYSPRRDEAELVSRRGSNDKTDVIKDKKEHFSVRVQLWKDVVTFLLCTLTLISNVYLFF